MSSICPNLVLATATEDCRSHTAGNLRCRLKFDLLNEDQIKDTFEPRIKVLPRSINKISDPSPHANIAISPRAGVAFGLHVEYRVLRLPLVCGGI
jgi:hypothetical protein